ncbi:MFS transporter [Oleisolibacter albus]|uniref:MFS transporter n=1 Tax=Oleisolibacter albus TaxID=2171757 RepID=UPI001EFE1EC8|nr:MFS transporter [Oleisolibacter albus]
MAPEQGGMMGVQQQGEAGPMIEAGTAGFRRITLAVAAAGFSTFALLYHVQPLLPLFAQEFGVSAAASALSLSLATGLLSVSLLLAGSLSDVWGRKPVMVASLMASALLTLASAGVSSWHAFLLMRALAGITLSGLPAVAMAYLGEEMHPRAIGLAMGLYISGTALGGMAGRLVTGVVADHVPWQVATLAIGMGGLLSGLALARWLPASRQFQPQPLRLGLLLRGLGAQFRDRGLRLLFLSAFLVMGSFVTVYNYIGFQLLGPPFDLSQTQVGLIFSAYLLGMGSSAWIGNLAGRLGRGLMLGGMVLLMLLGTVLTLLPWLPAVVAGIAALTFGFFGAHSVASSWVGRRAGAAKAQASSLYLYFYYMGSSLAGGFGGVLFGCWHWTGVVGLVLLLLLAALIVAGHLRRMERREAITL